MITSPLRRKSFGCAVAWMLVMAFVLATPTLRAGDPDKPSKKRPDIYDRNADGNRQIDKAVAKAARDNKRVLLMFGANWCVWCHRLHEVFENNREIARALLYEYELVLIDLDRLEDGRTHNEDVDARYGNPRKLGLPALVVLDGAGKQLTTQETGALEEGDHHDPAKVLGFLNKWKANPLKARDVLDGAVARAAKENKLVFAHFSAPWCGWCRKMDDYLETPEIASIIGSAFVPVKIDIDRMEGGKLLDHSFREEGGGIPFFIILDADGKKIADGNSAKGNVGFPVEPHEVEHFLTVMRETKRFSEADVKILASGLAAKKK